jgi:hypothetical protein
LFTVDHKWIVVKIDTGMTHVDPLFSVSEIQPDSNGYPEFILSGTTRRVPVWRFHRNLTGCEPAVGPDH